MDRVFDILEQIENTSSRNAKKDILRKHKDNELLKKVFLYTYNTRWVYGIGKKSIKSFESNIKTAPDSNIKQRTLFEMFYTDIFKLLDEIKLHPFGSNEDVYAVNKFLSTCKNKREYDWYVKIILRNLKIGCTTKTINQVYKNLIPEFSVMLAHPHEKHIHKVKGEFQLQQKLDGYRFLTYYHPDKSLQFFTRNGVELFDFPEIERAFKDNVKPQVVTMVYDGELLSNNNFNDTQKKVFRVGKKRELVYNVFDVITIDEFNRKESFDKLFTRYNLLQSLVSDNDYIKVVPELYRGNDLSQITKWFDYAQNNGWEGIMLKCNSPYVRKRSDTMLKFKKMNTIDLRVVKLNEGTGKYKGMLGSVTVSYKDNYVNVGSGFDEYSRKLYWEEQNRIFGKIIEIQYFEECSNQDGTFSLRFPIFKRIRLDKE